MKVKHIKRSENISEESSDEDSQAEVESGEDEEGDEMDDISDRKEEENDEVNAASNDEEEEDDEVNDASSNEEEEGNEMNDASGSEEEENDKVGDACTGVEDSENNDEDLAASDTESDSDDEEDGEDAVAEKSPKTKNEVIKREVLEKYQKHHGKRLYIRFPRTIADEELEQKAKELSTLIVKVHRPRQKYARFCLVDFETKDDRDLTLKTLKKLIRKGELEKYQVEIPRTENAEYVDQIAERKIKSLENKRVKARLKKASKKAANANNFTSTVLVFNLPKATTIIQVRELFPSAIDIQIKTGKGKVNKDKKIAVVTLPSTMEARAAAKTPKSLGGNQLKIKFDNQKMKKKGTIPQKSQQIPKGSKKTKANSKPSPKKHIKSTNNILKQNTLQDTVEENCKTPSIPKLPNIDKVVSPKPCLKKQSKLAKNISQQQTLQNAVRGNDKMPNKRKLPNVGQVPGGKKINRKKLRLGN